MTNDRVVGGVLPARSSDKLAEQLFCRRTQPAAPISAALATLAEDAVYEVFIAQAQPYFACFRGRAQVAEYLALVEKTYRVVAPNPLQILSAENRVLVRSSEIAHLLQWGQLVRTEWMADIQLTDGRISKVVMSIYDWKVLYT